MEKGNQYQSTSTIEIPNTQSSHEDHENSIEMLCRFYRQISYDDQLQVYAFVDTNARVPAEGHMYIIFHKPTK